MLCCFALCCVVVFLSFCVVWFSFALSFVVLLLVENMSIGESMVGARLIKHLLAGSPARGKQKRPRSKESAPKCESLKCN